MTSDWTRIDANSWVARSTETSGSSTVTWLQDPNRVDSDGHPILWLHKSTHIPANGWEQGEDWAELVSAEVAAELTVPFAEVQICERAGRRGSLSRNLRTDRSGFAFDQGAVVLQDCQDVVGYFPHREGEPAVDPARPGVQRPGHTLENIRLALTDTDPPLQFCEPALTSFDVFAGFTILDALIANRDRHEQNWAVLSSQLASSNHELAATFDHAGGLGYNLTDQKREQMVADESQLRLWALKGTAHRCEWTKASPPESLVDHAAKAVRLCSSVGADYWQTVIHSLNLDPLYERLGASPPDGMSDPAAKFSIELLKLNLRRMRDVI